MGNTRLDLVLWWQHFVLPSGKVSNKLPYSGTNFSAAFSHMSANNPVEIYNVERLYEDMFFLKGYTLLISSKMSSPGCIFQQIINMYMYVGAIEGSLLCC